MTEGERHDPVGARHAVPLPEGWRWVRLGEVCEVLMGQSPPGSTYNHKGIGLPFFQGKADFGELHPTPRVWCAKPMKIAEAGDILISVRAPVGPTNLAKERCCIGRGLAALRAGHKVQTDWVLFYLRSIEQDLGQSGSGSTFNAITKKELGTILIPLPPLPEQRRIVARIEELMSRMREAKRLRQEAKEDAERLWQSVLADTFPRPGQELPKGWRWVRLGEVVNASFSGGTPPTKVQAYWDGDIPWTTSAPIAEEDVFLKTHLRTITQEGLVNSASKIAPSGSLILATRVGVGKAVVATFDVAISQDLTALILSDHVKPLFLAYLFKSGTVQAQVRTRTRGTTIKGIHRKDLLTALIPLPPLSEQRRIVAHLEAVQEKLKALKEAQAATDAELQRLEQAVLDKAFRGEL